MAYKIFYYTSKYIYQIECKTSIDLLFDLIEYHTHREYFPVDKF